MNLEKIIKEILLETFGQDNNDIYEYTEISDGKYNFKTEKGTEYVVNLMKYKNGILFNYSANGSFDDIVNEGNMYKVLRTVFTAIKEYTNKNNWIKFITYLPVRKGNEDIKSNVRHKLYLRFLKQFYNISDKDIKIKEAALKGDYYVFVKIKK